MKLTDIDPLLRNAVRISYPAFITEQTIISYDHRLFYVVEGTGSIKFLNNEYSFIKGDLIIIQSATPYMLKAINKSKLELIVLNFDYTKRKRKLTDRYRPVALKDFDPGLVVENAVFTDYLFLNEPIVLHDFQHIEFDLNDIVNEFIEHKNLYRDITSGILKKILINMIRAASIMERQNNNNGETIVNKAIGYIRNHYMDADLNNASIAAALNYHSYYINHLFKAYTGLSLHQYLTMTRMNRAIELLISTNILIADISSRIGYKTQAHFSTCFKKVVGKNPLAYRHEFNGV